MSYDLPGGAVWVKTWRGGPMVGEPVAGALSSGQVAS